MDKRNLNLRMLKERQTFLKDQICNNLDLLMGSLGLGPSKQHNHLTIKVDGKTVTRYVRKGLVPKVKNMTECHKKLRALIRELSDVNWELLKLESG